MMNRAPRDQAETEKLLDELCDQFEQDVANSTSPEFAAWINRVPEALTPRLAKELFLVYLELHGLERLTGFVNTQKEKHPHHANLIDEAFQFAQENDRALKETASFSATDSAAHQEPLRVAGYKLLQVIGEGGMGSVYMADQVEPIKRRVAIKIIKASVPSKELIARFEAERQAIAMMDHPNVAKILDAGTTDGGQPFFAMELVKGVSLLEYCDANRLGLRQRLELFRQVCDGVQHAHQKGVLHRDLKPSNILVAQYNGEPVPKIIDFGLAKAIESDLKLTEKSMFTEFGQVMGSFKYMSPEQAGLDSLDIDTRSDVYSLGVILYELLTGTTPLDSEPFGRQGLLKVLELIRDQESPRPSNRIDTTENELLLTIAERRGTSAAALRQSVSGDLDWIVVKTLEKDRRQRYDTVSQLSGDIQCFIQGDPVAARPPSFRYYAVKFIGKHQGFFASAALAIALLLGGIAFSSWFAWRANRAELAARQAEKLAIRNAEQSDATLSILLGAFDELNPDQGGSATLPAIEILRRAEAEIKQAKLDVPITTTAYRSLTLAYIGIGDYSAAVRTGRKSVENHRLFFGAEDSRTKDAENDLAVALTKSGSVAEALPLLEAVHAYYLSSWGPDSRKTLQVLDNLANAYNAVGKVEQATTIYQRNAEKAQRILNADDPLRFDLVNSLAAHRYQLGDADGSLQLLEKNHAAITNVLPTDDLLRMRVAKNLAVSYKNAGRIQEAAELTEQTLAVQRTRLGKAHPDTLSTQNNLATFYLESGQTEVALDLLLTTLQTQQRVNPPGDRLTFRTMANAGNAYMQAGELQKAIEYLSDAYRQTERFFGPNDRLALQTKFQLAVAHLNAGDLETGAAMYESVVAAIQSGASLEGIAAKEIMSQRSTLIETILAKVDELSDSEHFDNARSLLETLGNIQQEEYRLRIQRRRETLTRSGNDEPTPK